MAKKSRSGQKRRAKNIKRLKRKEKRETKKQINITARETVTKKSTPPNKILESVETKASLISHREFFESLNSIINRDELALEDTTYENYLETRNKILSSVVEEVEEIWRSITINVGVDYSFILEPTSSEMILRKFKEADKKEFIDEMLNKACGFNIIEEEGDEIYHKPINFEIDFWFNFKKSTFKKKMILKTRFLGNGSFKYTFDSFGCIDIVEELKKFLLP